MKKIERILVPTDFSEFSLAGLDYVMSLSVLYDAQIYLLNVLENDAVLAFHSVDHQSETALRDRQKTAEDILRRLIASKFHNMQNVVPVVRRGDPAKEIVQFSEQEEVDLIVMATHGRTGLLHVLVGSVTEKVVRYSQVPVLTVRPRRGSESLLEREDIEEQLHLR
jgi:universal stress protein A